MELRASTAVQGLLGILYQVAGVDAGVLCADIAETAKSCGLLNGLQGLKAGFLLTLGPFG